jgi:hypothetical protein
VLRLGGFRDLDRILRGDATRPSELEGGSLGVAGSRLLPVLVILGLTYGLFMGSFALVNRDAAEPMQLVATMLKVPALFLLTLGVTFPSLYVFNALVGSRLAMGELLRLLLASQGVTLAILASLGPIVGFFSLTSGSYPFMILLHVAVFGVAGVMGLTFLLQTLDRLGSPARRAWERLVAEPAEQPDATEHPDGSALPPAADDDEAAPAPGPLQGPVLGAEVRTVFRCWVVLFGVVGAQMSWVLRPFVGDPGEPFTWFRARESNFFEAVWGVLVGLLS